MTRAPYALDSTLLLVPETEDPGDASPWAMVTVSSAPPVSAATHPPRRSVARGTLSPARAAISSGALRVVIPGRPPARDLYEAEEMKKIPTSLPTPVSAERAREILDSRGAGPLGGYGSPPTPDERSAVELLQLQLLVEAAGARYVTFDDALEYLASGAVPK